MLTLLVDALVAPRFTAGLVAGFALATLIASLTGLDALAIGVCFACVAAGFVWDLRASCRKAAQRESQPRAHSDLERRYPPRAP